MIGGQTTAFAVYSYGAVPLHVKFMVSIAIQPPHSSTLLPGHAVVQLADGTAPTTESPHMHCLPFSTPASLFWRPKHASMHCSLVVAFSSASTQSRPQSFTELFVKAPVKCCSSGFSSGVFHPEPYGPRSSRQQYAYSVSDTQHHGACEAVLVPRGTMQQLDVAPPTLFQLMHAPAGLPKRSFAPFRAEGSLSKVLFAYGLVSQYSPRSSEAVMKGRVVCACVCWRARRCGRRVGRQRQKRGS